MRAVTRLLLVTLAALPFAASAVTWNMATPYPEATFHTQNDEQFAKDIEQATDGSLTINIHPAGSLIKHPQIKRAVQTGQVQAGEVFISILGNENPVFSVDSVPFLATSYDQARALWNASRPKIESLLAEDGIKLLYAVPWPPQGLYVSKPIDSVDDLKGLKFRAYNSETSTLAKLTGMVPTQVEVPEIPQAFSTGIVEAMITSPSTGANSNAWDFVNRFYDIQAWIPKNMIMVNQRAFDSLSKDQQKAVMDAAKAAEKRGWKMSREESSSKKQVLEKHGMKVLQPSEKLMSGLRDIGTKMTKQWLEDAGEDGQAIIDNYRKATD